MSIRLLSTLLVASAIGGCANYRAVSTFAHETTSMTAVVDGEFTELATLCMQQAALALAVDDIDDDRALAQCEADRRTRGRFASVTVDVLDGYAQALAALADDRRFDLSPSVRSTVGKVEALRDGAGDPLIGTADADAIKRIVALLVDVVAARGRDEAVDRMIAATPDLVVLGRTLKAFFVAPPGATTSAPYANVVAVIAGSATSTRLLLQSRPMRQAEPIRTAELLRELRVRTKLLDQRDHAVPTRIAAAIDAWLAALDRFAIDARQPDSRDWLARLEALREATRVARAAVAND
jgi:hypothetical protein